MSEELDGEYISWGGIAVGGKSDERTFSFDDWRPTKPRSDKEIWRYRSLERYISILDQQCLWFSRPDEFDDPFEGSLPRKNIEKRRRKYNQSVSKDRSAVRYIYRFTAYLNCWYSENHESDAMWRIYSEDGNALAIKSTPSNLRKAIDNPDSPISGEVEYRDYQSFEITTENPMAPLFYKRSAFDFEKEFRILVHYYDNSLAGSNSENIKEVQPRGVPVEIDVDTLIDEVVISPTASGEFVDIVKNITNLYGYDFPIDTSNLLDDEHAYF